MRVLEKIEQKILKRKYKKCKKPLYIVVCWAKWAILPCKFYKMGEHGPLTIQYNDHNGEWEHYHIAPWYTETSGMTIAYFFDKNDAEALADRLNRMEKLYNDKF